MGTVKFSFSNKKWEDDTAAAKGESITFPVQNPAVLNVSQSFQEAKETKGCNTSSVSSKTPSQNSNKYYKNIFTFLSRSSEYLL